MRRPRPGDFDPDYQIKDSSPEPDTIDVSGVVPIKEKQIYESAANPRTEQRTKNRPEIRTEERTENRSENRSVKLPVKRITKRYSFEFFEDQITRLKQIKYEIEMTGERIAMSSIVREALDEYLQKQKE